MKRCVRALSIGALILLILPIVASMGCTMWKGPISDWRSARRDSSGQAPIAATTREAIIQVYAARTVGWRGALAVHTWIAVKPSGAAHYTRYEVVGWGVGNGYPAIRVTRGAADHYWFGAEPEKLAERRGEGVDALIERVEAAVKSYPYPSSYRTWPGPNSNTFIAHIGRSVPELRLDLPPTAIGKDFIAGGGVVAPTPSGTGYQLSLFGALGVTAALSEGIELNVLGLSFGVDVGMPALKLPGLGRIGFAR